MRIALFGYADLARHCVHALKVLGCDIRLFCPREDASLLERALMTHLGLPVVWFDRFADLELSDALEDFDPDCVLSVIFNHRIPGSVLQHARLGSLNVHPAPLPAFRTASPWFWPVHEGLRESEICLHHLTQNLDQGPVVLRQPLDLSPCETQGTYARRINDAAPFLMERLHRLLQAPPLPQGEVQGKGRHFPPVQMEDIVIDFTRPVADIEALVRACNPFHTARTSFRGRTLGVHQADSVPGLAGEPGAVVSAGDDFLVNAADGRVRLSVVDVPGEGVVTGGRLAGLYQIRDGEIMGDREEPGA